MTQYSFVILREAKDLVLETLHFVQSDRKQDCQSAYILSIIPLNVALGRITFTALLSSGIK